MAYNAQVAAQQKALNAKGANLKVDGIMGPKTQAAAAKYATPAPKITTPAKVVTPVKTPTPTPPPAQKTVLTPPPKAPAYTPPPVQKSNPTVGKNISSIPTTTIQKALGVTADGKIGSQTTAAIKKFQSENGLVADGIVGPKTEAVLKAKTSTTPTAGIVAPTPTGQPLESTSTGIPLAPKVPVTPAKDGQFALTGGNLQQGSFNNQNVNQLQTLLKSKGYNLSVDGDFGQQTKSAVMKFQQDNGIKVDGIVGPETTAALNKLKAEGITTGVTSPTINNAPTTDIPTGKPGEVVDPKTEIAGMNDLANAEAEKLAASLSSVNSNATVDTSASSKLLASLTDLVTEKQKEPTKSLAEQLSAKRAELGVDPLETEVNSIDAKIAALDNEYKTLSDTETNRQVSVMQINRRKSDEQIKYEAAKNELIAQKNSVANELNNKYSVIDTYMKYAGADYDNAQQEYTKQFNETISVMNLVKGIEDDAKSDIERKQDNAKGNLTLMINSLKDKDFSSLDSGTLASLDKLAMESGIPKGVLKGILGAKDEVPIPKPIAKTTSEIKQSAIDTTISKFNSIAGADGYVAPERYISERAKSSLSPTEFDSRFGKYVNPLSRVAVGLDKAKTSSTNPYDN